MIRRANASPPMIPSPVLAAYYQIVQTDESVLIATEWIHDARVIRMNSTHLPSTVRKWLGDSIGHWDGATLVVDTTNFRPESHNLDDPDTWATPWKRQAGGGEAVCSSA